MHAHTVEAFLARLHRAWGEATFVSLVLSKPRDAGSDLRRVTVRPVALKGGAKASFVFSHATRDVTRNVGLEQATGQLAQLLGASFDHAHLHTTAEQIQLKISKKGKVTVSASAATSPGAAAPERAPHDRAKQRPLALDRAFLRALGVTDASGQLVPAKARKWKQINKFVELLDQAVGASALARADALTVLDFGSGKGYLTFATHDHLSHTLGKPTQVTGVELRADMVELCETAVRTLGLQGLRFELGDVRSAAPARADIVIALHACDTATDHAIHLGVRAGATVIMCSPCCHKELRPQLLSPHPLRPILKHGIHLAQQAEMLTDGLRAMLLDACGYDTKVFEFVALEHSQKNKMILAVKRPTVPDGADVRRQIQDVKAYYGIQQQCLETLLFGPGAAAQA